MGVSPGSAQHATMGSDVCRPTCPHQQEEKSESVEVMTRDASTEAKFKPPAFKDLVDVKDGDRSKERPADADDGGSPGNRFDGGKMRLLVSESPRLRGATGPHAPIHMEVMPTAEKPSLGLTLS